MVNQSHDEDKNTTLGDTRDVMWLTGISKCGINFQIITFPPKRQNKIITPCIAQTGWASIKEAPHASSMPLFWLHKVFLAHSQGYWFLRHMAIQSWVMTETIWPTRLKIYFYQRMCVTLLTDGILYCARKYSKTEEGFQGWGGERELQVLWCVIRPVTMGKGDSIWVTQGKSHSAACGNSQQSWEGLHQIQHVLVSFHTGCIQTQTRVPNIPQHCLFVS